MSSQFSVISFQFHFLRQLRTNDLCIRGDSLKTIANNELSVFSHQFSVAFFKNNYGLMICALEGIYYRQKCD